MVEVTAVIVAGILAAIGIGFLILAREFSRRSRQLEEGQPHVHLNVGPDAHTPAFRRVVADRDAPPAATSPKVRRQKRNALGTRSKRTRVPETDVGTLLAVPGAGFTRTESTCQGLQLCLRCGEQRPVGEKCVCKTEGAEP